MTARWFVFLILVVSLATVVWRPLVASACDVNWNVDADGLWSEGSNWDTGVPPTSGQAVCIERPGADVTVTVNHNAGTVTSVTSSETLRLTGSAAWLRVQQPSATTNLLMEGGDLTWQSAGAWTVSGDSIWSGGSISGPITNSGVFTFTSATELIPWRAVFTNQGTIVHLDGDINDNSGGGGTTIINEAGALYDIRSDVTFLGSQNFHNSGTLRKSGGSGTAVFSEFWHLNNANGLIEVQSGQLNWGRGTSTGGHFHVSGGATLDLTGGHTNPAPTFTGLYTGEGQGRVEISSGQFNIGSGGATFDFPPGLFHWRGGAIAGNVAANPLTNLGQITLSGPDDKAYYRLNLHNQGEIRQTDDHTIVCFSFCLSFNLYNEPGSLTHIQGNLDGGTGLVVHNSGLIRKSGSSGETLLAYFHSLGGSIEVQAGTLNLAGSGTSTGGHFHVEAGALLDISQDVIGNGQQNWTGLYTGSGGGVIRHRGFLTGPTGVSRVLDFPPGLFQWQSGNLMGDIVNEGTVTLVGDAPKYMRSIFANNGDFVVTGAGVWQFYVTTEFTNNGLIDFQSDANVQMIGVNCPSCATRIENHGTLRKSDGLGTTLVHDPNNFGHLRLDNQGVVEVLSGKLHWDEPVIQMNTAAQTLTGGTWLVDQFATLEFTAGTVQTNQGDVTLRGPASAFTNLGQLVNNNGRFALENGRDWTMSNNLNNGGELVLGPASRLTVPGQFTQTGSGLLAIGVSGSSASGDFGELAISSTAALNGVLHIALAPGFIPQPEDGYTIATYASRSGNFAAITGHVPFFEVTVTDTAVLLNVVEGLSVVDLALDPTSITFPANGIAGQEISASYTVHNLSDEAAEGSWVDSIYLSLDPSYSPDDWLLGRVTHSESVPPLGSYVGQLTAPLPAVTGNYYLIVIVDSRFDLLDPDRDNNRGASSAPLAVDVPILPFDTLETGQISHGQAIYYRLDVPAGGDAIIAAEFEVDLQAEFFVRYQQLPTPSQWDFVAPDLYQLQRQIRLASPQAGPYYVLLHGREGAGSGQTYTLHAEHVPFALDEVTPALGSNAGQTTSVILGAGFTPDTAVHLLGTGGNPQVTAQVQFVNANTLFAAFDLAGQATGVYDVAATNDGNQALLPGGFTITDDPAGALDVWITTPGSVRPGRRYQARIEYANVGATDIVAPTMWLEIENAVMKLPHELLFSAEKRLLVGINETGPAGILPPGAQGSIRLDFIPADTTTLTVLELISGATIDWAAQKESLRPHTVPEDAWDVIFANFMAGVGNTTDQFQAQLAANATYLSLLDLRTADGSELLVFEFQKAGDFGRLAQNFRLGRFGRNYADPFNFKADVEPAGHVTIIAGSHRWPFLLLPDGSYQGVPGVLATLTQLNGELIFQTPDGSTMVFDENGRLLSFADANGRGFTAGYDGQGQLAALLDSNGDLTQISYNAHGRIAQIEDAVGRLTTFTYDAAGEYLHTISDASGTTTLTFVTDPNLASRHAVASITLFDGRQRTFAYDERGRLAATWDGSGTQTLAVVYGEGARTTHLDALGRETHYWFDDRGGLRRVEDGLGRINWYTYDERNSLTEVRQPDGRIWSYAYDERGNATVVNNPLGGQYRASFDPLFNALHLFRDARGHNSLYPADGQGNLDGIIFPDGSAEAFNRDGRGNLTQYTNRRAQALARTYDDKDLLLSADLDADWSADYTYDAHRNLETISDAEGVIEMAYDAADRLTQISYANGRSLTFGYDSNGRLTQTSDGANLVVNYSYDAAGRLAEMRDGIDNLIVAYAYNGAGQLLGKTLGNGATTSYSYDGAGQLTAILDLAPDNSIIASIAYTYDALGRRTSAATPQGTTSFSYNSIGWLTAMQLPDGANIAYEYDAAGNRITAWVDGVATPYTTNNLDQYLTIGPRSFSYDADGNLVIDSGPSGTITYEYGAYNRLTAVSSAASTTLYEYNPLGQRTAVIQDGQRREYLADPANLADVVAEYDDNGDLIAAYIHTPDGNLVARLSPGGQKAYYHFDAIGNTVALSGPAGELLNEYSYLPFGELLAASETVPNPFRFNGEWGIMDDGNGLHYMRARYYRAAEGRFISIDPLRVPARELYTFALNDPVSINDPSGLQPPELPCYTPAWIRNFQQSSTKYYDDVFAVTDPHSNITEMPDPSAMVSDLQAGSRWAGQMAMTTMPTRPPVKTVGRTVGRGIRDCFPPTPRPKPPSPKPPCQPGATCTPGPDGTSPLVTSYDPNEIIGPAGYGPQGYITPDRWFDYVVLFENDPDLATAPAQEVFIIHQLDANLDWTTFEIGDFGFGDLIVQVPPGRRSYYTRVDLQATHGFVVDFEAGIDLATGIVLWTFTTIDPDTGDLISDAEAGFLPPNVNAPEGEGFVNFTVRPLPGLPTGATIEAEARIIFDTNEPIDTAVYLNTISVNLSQPPVQFDRFGSFSGNSHCCYYVHEPLENSIHCL